MKPVLDLSIFDEQHVTLNESRYLEYKETTSFGMTRVVQETICAFLNNRGGCLVMGVTDKLEVVGIDKDDYDRFMTNVIDSIFHQYTIISKVGDRLDPNLIQACLHQTKSGKYLIIIDVTTDLLETSTCRSYYRLRNGPSFFRLNASNLEIDKSPRLYTQNELDSAKELHAESSKIKYEKKIKTLVGRYEKLDRQLAEYELKSEIELKQKDQKIEELEEKIKRMSLLCMKLIDP